MHLLVKSTQNISLNEEMNHENLCTLCTHHHFLHYIVEHHPQTLDHIPPLVHHDHSLLVAVH